MPTQVLARPAGYVAEEQMSNPPMGSPGKRDTSGPNPGWDGRQFAAPPARPPAAPPRPADDPLIPTGFSGWADRVSSVFRRFWLLLGALSVASAVPQVFYQHYGAQVGSTGTGSTAHLRGPVSSWALFGLLWVVVNLVTELVAWWVVIRRSGGLPGDPAAGLRFGIRRFFPLVGWGILAGVLVGIGIVLLIVPGVYLGIVFLATLPGVVLVEHGSIGRCFRLAHRALLPTAGRILLFVVLVVIYSEVVNRLIAKLAGESETALWVYVVDAVIELPLAIMSVAVVVVTYAELRGVESPTLTSSGLAAEISR